MSDNEVESGDVDAVEPFARKPSDYDDREGYQSDFLGSRPALTVEMPRVDPLPEETAAAGGGPTGTIELKYTRFTVVVSKRRRFCRVAAVNIAGDEPFFKMKRVAWRRDVRVSQCQEDNEVLYGPDI